MIAGNNGITKLPGSVKVTLILIVARFHTCTMNHPFSDILKQQSSVLPATRDRWQLHRPHTGCRCSTVLLCERRQAGLQPPSFLPHKFSLKVPDLCRHKPMCSAGWARSTLYQTCTHLLPRSRDGLSVSHSPWAASWTRPNSKKKFS